MTATRRAMQRRREQPDEAGFTLIELVTVVVILPLVMGGITAALLSVLSLNDSVSNRVGDSNDELVSSSTFNKDVQSAQQIETTTTPGCGTGTQLIGLQWGLDANGNYDTVVSYTLTQVGSTQRLVRQLCTSGASTTATSTNVIGDDPGTPTVTFNPSGFIGPNTGWTSTHGLYGITLSVTAPNSGYSYSLNGLPSAGSSTGSVSQVIQAPNPAGCNLASPGSGTYANELCFADFSSFTDPTAGCQQMKLAIENSPDFLQFCVIASPNDTVRPQSIPTYPDAASPQFGYDSEAYLGNNGFYTGIPGKGALSQRPQSAIGFAGAPTPAVTAITFTNVEVTNAVGEPQTGWTLVTGDAESTDTNGWLEFQNNTVPWSILPNTSSSLWGNSCYDGADSPTVNGVSNPYSGALEWIGPALTAANYTDVGTPTSGPPASQYASVLTVGAAPTYNTGANGILCEANLQLNKTGSMMVAAPEPTGSNAPQNITVTLRGEGGTGYQAIFLGVML